MKLQVGQSIDNGNVRLDFRKSPDKPKNSPSYIIDKSKADEFVKKYNDMEQKLLRNTNLTVAILAVAGWVVSIAKRSLKMALFGIPAGIVAGLGIGAGISAYQKNKLMDNYHVKEFKKL